MFVPPILSITIINTFHVFRPTRRSFWGGKTYFFPIDLITREYFTTKKPALACRFPAEKEGFAEPAGSSAGGSDRPPDGHSLPPGSNPLLLSA